MAKDLWLPNGYELADGSKIQLLLFSGADWQIYNTQVGNTILVTLPELAQKWWVGGFIDESLFGSITFGSAAFRYLCTKKNFILTPVENGKSPDRKVDAVSFSVSLKESRNISSEPSFHDAIYVEQFSRLLPTWTLTPHVSDDVVLGTWISGGVVISTRSFRRLSKFASWLSPKHLTDIITAAGFQNSGEGDALTKQDIDSQTTPDVKMSIAVTSEEAGHQKTSSSELGNKKFVLPGRPKLEEFFKDHVIDIIENSEKYKILGIESPAAIVLHGPPGCGKTFAVERLVEYLDWPSFSIDSNSVGSPYIHATSKKISEIFDKAMDAAPSVIVIDEMESFLSDRQSGSTSGLHHVEEVAEFLRRIPEAVKHNVLIIAMTNMIDMIDPAILRRGRFDHIIEVPMPSRIEVSALIDSLLSKLPKSDDINKNLILDALTEKPLSDSAFLIREAARLAAKSGKTSLDQESISIALINLSDSSKKKNKQMGFGINHKEE